MTTAPLRLAHRGDWRRGPENSLPAFTAAMSVPGCDGIELDVRLAGDGTPVVIHDATLDRVHGRPDRVSDLAADALAAVGVPSLAGVLEALPAHAFLDVELKVDGGPAVTEVLARSRGRSLNRAAVSSFDPGAIETVRRREPGWPCWLNADDLDMETFRTARDLGCVAVAAGWRAIDARWAAVARDRDLELAAYTVRRRATFRRLARLGVMAVCVEGAALDHGGNGHTGMEVRA